MGRVGGLWAVAVLALVALGGGEAWAATATTRMVEADDRGTE